MKKYIIASTLLSMTIILGGCGTTPPKPNTTDQKATIRNREELASSTRRMMADLPKGTMSDLTIGNKITVVGKTNADGTILAERIMIGEWKMPSFGSSPSTTLYPEGDRPARTNNPTDGQTGMPQRRNMARVGGGQNSTNGEILKIDEVNIVLKLTDGNSKIIFFSASTTINFAPTTTPPIPEKK